jgi:NurA domain
MLYRELLSNEINNKRVDFVTFDDDQNRDLEQYLHVLNEMSELTSADVSEKLADFEDVGALPSRELDDHETFSVHFTEKWENHEQARNWAAEILADRTTFAADASQVLPGRDITLPVAAIQVGWFENPHNGKDSYEKNAKLILLSPKDLLENQEEPMNPESRVGEMRFHAEVDRVAEFLGKKKGWQERGERMPLAFFDGTLLVSFSLPQTKLQISFVQKMVELVNLSRKTKVPVVGYVDRSYSRDILHLLDAFSETSQSASQTLYDATILRPQNAKLYQVLKNWGDRSVFCFSKRKGLNAFIDVESGDSLVGFTYLQTTSDGPPARIDVPSWIYEDGLLDELIDVIRAECVIGLGYPYALETADATAVISVRDREIFLGALQEFANREKLNFSVSRKSASKGRRR